MNFGDVVAKPPGDPDHSPTFLARLCKVKSAVGPLSIFWGKGRLDPCKSFFRLGSLYVIAHCKYL